MYRTPTSTPARRAARAPFCGKRSHALIALAVTGHAVGCGAAADGDDFAQSQSAVIGGETVTDAKEFPDAVALLATKLGATQKAQQFCGATLIDDPYNPGGCEYDVWGDLVYCSYSTRWAVTAMHCFGEKAAAVVQDCRLTPANCKALTNTTALSTNGKKKGTEVPFDLIIPHPNYVAATHDNDIALIHLATPVSRDTPFTTITAFTSAAAANGASRPADPAAPFVVTPRTVATAFTDSFTTDTLTRYGAYAPLTTQSSGTPAWKYSAGTIVEASNAQGQSIWDGPHLIHKTQWVRNGDVSATIKTPDDDTGGVVARFTVNSGSHQSFYEFAVNEATQTAALVLYYSNAEYVLATKKLTAFKWGNVNHQLTLRLASVSLSGLVDGKVVVTSYAVKDANGNSVPFLDQGRVGFTKDALATAAFDDLVVAPASDGKDARGAFIAGVPVTPVGWGDTVVDDKGVGSTPSATLQAAPDIEYIGRGTGCYGITNFSAAGTALTNNMLCAGDLNRDTCTYDSGGPLFVKAKTLDGSSDRWTLLGITANGHGCAEPGWPGIYTIADPYRGWLDATQFKYAPPDVPVDPWN